MSRPLLMQRRGHNCNRHYVAAVSPNFVAICCLFRSGLGRGGWSREGRGKMPCLPRRCERPFVRNAGHNAGCSRLRARIIWHGVIFAQHTPRVTVRLPIRTVGLLCTCLAHPAPPLLEFRGAGDAYGWLEDRPVPGQPGCGTSRRAGGRLPKQPIDRVRRFRLGRGINGLVTKP